MTQSHRSNQAELERTFRLMDVADELRRRNRRVQDHLEVSDRENIKNHLLARYQAMGHEADPALLDEAIDTVLQQQYRFREPRGGLGGGLASMYVRRGWLARWAGIPLLMLALLVAGSVYAVRVARQMSVAGDTRAVERLVSQADGHWEAIEDLAKEDGVRERAVVLQDDARRHADAGRVAELESTVQELSRLEETLAREYKILILRGRERDNVRHYLIVEARDGRERLVTVRVRNEETGRFKRVTEWGERVSKDVYDRVARDYREDNVIDDNVFGEKERGYLMPRLRYESFGKITEY